MFRNFFNMFRRGRLNKVSFISRMHTPQQIVRSLHAQGVDVCFDQAELLLHGIHDQGLDEDDVDDIIGLEA